MAGKRNCMVAKHKCGYCGYLIKDMKLLLEHECFEYYDEMAHNIYIDEYHTVVFINRENIASKESNNMVWNSDWDEMLITEVAKRPALYNYTLSVKERSLLKTNDLWKEIYNSLGVCSVNVIKSRWKFLKTKFMEAKSKERSYKRSGSAAQKKEKLHDFQLFEMMGFLEDTSKHMKTNASVSSESQSESEFEFEKEEKIEKDRKMGRYVLDEQYHHVLFNSMDFPKDTNHFDEPKMATLSLGPSLKLLNRERRERVQKKFQRILMEELQDQESTLVKKK